MLYSCYFNFIFLFFVSIRVLSPSFSCFYSSCFSFFVFSRFFSHSPHPPHLNPLSVYLLSLFLSLPSQSLTSLLFVNVSFWLCPFLSPFCVSSLTFPSQLLFLSITWKVVHTKPSNLHLSLGAACSLWHITPPVRSQSLSVERVLLKVGALDGWMAGRQG